MLTDIAVSIFAAMTVNLSGKRHVSASLGATRAGGEHRLHRNHGLCHVPVVLPMDISDMDAASFATESEGDVLATAVLAPTVAITASARERVAGAALEAGADSLAVRMLLTTSSSTLIELTEEPPTEGTK